MPTLIGHDRLMVHGVTWPWATGPFPIVFLQLFSIFPWTKSRFSPFSHEQNRFFSHFPMNKIVFFSQFPMNNIDFFPFSREFPLTHVGFSGVFPCFSMKKQAGDGPMMDRQAVGVPAATPRSAATALGMAMPQRWIPWIPWQHESHSSTHSETHIFDGDWCFLRQ